jgi:hypothetical protein
MVGDIEYNEELDFNKKMLLKVPKEIQATDEEIVEDACLKEKSALENLVLPGINRHMMPPVPTKSKRIRDAERPQVYPFCILPVEDVERGIILKSFQDLMKAN